MVIVPPHTIYNTRHRSVSEAINIASSASAMAFRVEDTRATSVGMKACGSWAYDNERQALPLKHGTHSNFK